MPDRSRCRPSSSGFARTVSAAIAHRARRAAGRAPAGCGGGQTAARAAGGGGAAGRWPAPAAGGNAGDGTWRRSGHRRRRGGGGGSGGAGAGGAGAAAYRRAAAARRGTSGAGGARAARRRRRREAGRRRRRAGGGAAGSAGTPAARRRRWQPADAAARRVAVAAREQAARPRPPGTGSASSAPGQSLAVGGHGNAPAMPIGATTQRFRNLKLSLGNASVPPFDPNNTTLSMVPLVETIRAIATGYPSPYPRNIYGESFHTAMADELVDAGDGGAEPRLHHRAHRGRRGRPGDQPSCRRARTTPARPGALTPRRCSRSPRSRGSPRRRARATAWARSC